MPNLPNTVSSHENQRLSFIRLHALLPTGKFIIRSEGGDDYGNDKILEAILDGTQVTNFRSHVQVKTKARADRNRDGSVSFPVEISNLNYLMNSPASLYLLYLVDEDSFLYEWVVEIFKFAQMQGIQINSTQQATLTYHFKKVLNQNECNAIYAKILGIGEAIRALNERKILYPGELQQAINLEFSKSGTISSQELADFIKLNGLPMTNQGRQGEVSSMVNRLPGSFKEDHELSFVAMYSKFSNGEFYEAFCWLPRPLDSSPLSQEKKIFISYMDASIQRQLGMSSDTDYNSRISELLQNNPNSLLTLQIRLDILRMKWVTSKEGREEIFNEILEVSNQLLGIGGNDSQITFQVRSGIWEIKGYQITFDSTDRLSQGRIRELMGFPYSAVEAENLGKEINLQTEELIAEFQELFSSPDTNISGKAILLCNYTLFLLQAIGISGFFKRSPALNELDKVHLEALERDLSSLHTLLDQESLWPLKYRVGLSLAEVKMALGFSSEANRLAQEAREGGKRIGFSKIVDNANYFLSGNSILMAYQAITRAAR